MNAAAPASPSSPPAAAMEQTRAELKGIRAGLVVGILGQILIWGSALTLWVIGSLYSGIPTRTNIAYGANGITISAWEIFALNLLLIVGIAAAVYSLVLLGGGFRKLAKTSPRFNSAGISALTTTGSIGFGLFAVAWVVWLGSFVAPGVNSPAVPGFYTPVLASSLSEALGILLFVGGVLAFLGMVGIAIGSSTIGITLEEPTIEVGGILSVLPVLSIVGSLLFILGLAHVDQKLKEGWVPPPPPPPTPPYLVPGYRPGAPAVSYYPAPTPQAGWDTLAAVLVVLLVLTWLIIIPIAFVATNGGVEYGPSSGGGGNGPSAGAASSANGSLSLLPLLLIGIIVTGLFLPIAVVRNRRKRERSALPPPPPPPPPPPHPPAPTADPLDHLV